MKFTRGRNCWDLARAEKAAVVVDAEAYFRAARSAMLRARHQILLIGWDFDARITLTHGDEHPEAPREVGAFIDWLVARTPTLSVHILRWDKGAIKSIFRGKTLLTLTRWRFFRRRIHLKLDGHHPVGASHHQKIVVIDDCIAFCGGIDMTDARWDTREHRDHEPRRRSPWGLWNKPWHDATTALSGPIAATLGALCRDRWRLAGGRPIPEPPAAPACWPDNVKPDWHGIDVAISRTVPAMPDEEASHEIEQLYVDLIAGAQRYIYAESQYFASRVVAEAIGRRLAEPDPPEIVIVNPVAAQGWLEPIAMDTARARLVAALRPLDHARRLAIYHPVTAEGTSIYVHAKIMIVDDRIIRVGSSNFNNRSLRLDTECDVTIVQDGDPAIRAIRDGLLAEHLARPLAQVAQALDTHGLIGAIERLRGTGKTLVPYEIPELSDIEAWLADNKVLDPEGPGEVFEPLARRRGLVTRLRRYRRQRRNGVNLRR